MGNLHIIQSRYDIAYFLYDIVNAYGYDSEILKKRRTNLNKLIEENRAICTTDLHFPKQLVNQWPIYAIGIAGMLAIILVLILFWRNYKRKHEL